MWLEAFQLGNNCFTLKEQYRIFTGVKTHRPVFSWEIRVSSFYLCHAAVEMSTLLAGGISTAALSSLLNLKLCCLLLPFYSFSKHRQKNHAYSHRINTCSTLSLGKKLLASEKQCRKSNNKHVDLSQFSRAWTKQPPCVQGKVKPYSQLSG